MKFNCGPSPETRRRRKRETADAEHRRLIGWHQFFALLPRRVGDNECRWLEMIERKGTRELRVRLMSWGYRPYYDYRWEYRAKQDNAE